METENWTWKVMTTDYRVLQMECFHLCHWVTIQSFSTSFSKRMRKSRYKQKLDDDSYSTLLYISISKESLEHIKIFLSLVLILGTDFISDWKVCISAALLPKRVSTRLFYKGHLSFIETQFMEKTFTAAHQWDNSILQSWVMGSIILPICLPHPPNQMWGL